MNWSHYFYLLCATRTCWLLSFDQAIIDEFTVVIKYEILLNSIFWSDRYTAGFEFSRGPLAPRFTVGSQKIPTLGAQLAPRILRYKYNDIVASQRHKTYAVSYFYEALPLPTYPTSFLHPSQHEQTSGSSIRRYPNTRCTRPRN